jgi:hypothetical protein
VNYRVKLCHSREKNLAVFVFLMVKVDRIITRGVEKHAGKRDDGS